MKLGKWRREARFTAGLSQGQKSHHLVHTMASSVLFPSLPDPFYEENVTWMGPILKGRVGLIEHESFFATDEQTNPPDFEDGGIEESTFKMLKIGAGMWEKS